MNQKIIYNGNRAVIINWNEKAAFANLYTNTRGGIDGADITNLRWTGKTIGGATRWAIRKLNLTEEK